MKVLNWRGRDDRLFTWASLLLHPLLQITSWLSCFTSQSFQKRGLDKSADAPRAWLLCVWSQPPLNSRCKSQQRRNSPGRAENKKSKKHQLTCQRRCRSCSSPKYGNIPRGNVAEKCSNPLNTCRLSSRASEDISERWRQQQGAPTGSVNGAERRSSDSDSESRATRLHHRTLLSPFDPQTLENSKKSNS